jgi:hypothetical protein
VANPNILDVRNSPENCVLKFEGQNYAAGRHREALVSQALINVVAAALGLISHARIQRIDLGAPGDELLMEIERAVPGSVPALNAICPIRSPLSVDDEKLREDVFAKLRGQSVKMALVDEIQRKPKKVNESQGRR